MSAEMFLLLFLAVYSAVSIALNKPLLEIMAGCVGLLIGIGIIEAVVKGNVALLLWSVSAAVIAIVIGLVVFVVAVERSTAKLQLFPQQLSQWAEEGNAAKQRRREYEEQQSKRWKQVGLCPCCGGDITDCDHALYS